MAETASVGLEPGAPPVPASPTSHRMPHDHVPGGMSCLTAVGCSGVGSVASDVPGLTAPGSVTAAEPLATQRAPRSIDLPTDDRPPRPV
ncbi:hypothetical protein [Thalassobaculum sp.]|uniref:hypothetical protein n=1 Tax=Thalassobaculum sp. TaxID=2022740 RepID=UPI0032EBDCBF